MRAFLKFNKGMLGMPLGWQAWMMLLVAANLVVPLYFVGRWEAQIVLIAFMGGVVLMTALTARFGFTRILGLGHILWVPLVMFLAGRLASVPAADAYGFWLRAVIVVNTISLLLDAVDVIRYARGDRGEVVDGL